jgi:protein TonB
VVILILIGKDGSIERARVVRSVNPRLDQAALEAVEQWRYRPASMNGTPVRVSQVIAIDFEN